LFKLAGGVLLGDAQRAGIAAGGTLVIAPLLNLINAKYHFITA